MRAIAEVRRRFGYRRLHVLREGYLVNHKKLFRLYQREKLAVRRRPGRKRAIGTKAPMRVPRAPNERGSLDFAQDQLTGPPLPYPDRGRRLTRECLAQMVDTSRSGPGGARTDG